jgi:threonylcarbamoyladenosine tRNA methylthiotransferase MtaB
LSDQPLGIHQFSGRTRAFLKIQDGCKAPCNYCIIPTVRPKMQSKPVRHVLEEAKALLNNGYQEIVLTGIRLGLYRGENWEGGNIGLLQLLKILAVIPLPFRIRLSSLEVTEVRDPLIEFVMDNPKICRHFHIPMQSGESGVLKAMGRWYDASFYQGRVKAIRQQMPDCGITADVMVGYPTETEEQFRTTVRFVHDLELSGLHVFRFSARQGTKAAELKPLDPRVVSRRAGELGELDKNLREKFYRRFEGTSRETLPEPSGEGWTDNYIRVHVPSAQVQTGLSHIQVWSPLYSERPAPFFAVGG